jgi:hypothetical protein
VSSTLWWTWTAPHTGLAHIRFLWAYGSVEVFTGPDVAHLTPVAGASTAVTPWWGQSGIELPAKAGIAYHIRFSANVPLVADIQISVLQDLLIPAQVSRLPGGPFQARYTATLPRTWRLDASTNLLSWEPLRWLAPFDGQIEWSDPDAADHPRRFYRLEPDP